MTDDASPENLRKFLESDVLAGAAVMGTATESEV